MQQKNQQYIRSPFGETLAEVNPQPIEAHRYCSLAELHSEYLKTGSWDKVGGGKGIGSTLRHNINDIVGRFHKEHLTLKNGLPFQRRLDYELSQSDLKERKAFIAAEIKRVGESWGIYYKASLIDLLNIQSHVEELNLKEKLRRANNALEIHSPVFLQLTADVVLIKPHKKRAQILRNIQDIFTELNKQGLFTTLAQEKQPVAKKEILNQFDSNTLIPWDLERKRSFFPTIQKEATAIANNIKHVPKNMRNSDYYSYRSEQLQNLALRECAILVLACENMTEIKERTGLSASTNPTILGVQKYLEEVNILPIIDAMVEEQILAQRIIDQNNHQIVKNDFSDFFFKLRLKVDYQIRHPDVKFNGKNAVEVLLKENEFFLKNVFENYSPEEIIDQLCLPATNQLNLLTLLKVQEKNIFGRNRSGPESFWGDLKEYETQEYETQEDETLDLVRKNQKTC